eukprot:TRINITY_DN4919_c0_g2_i1.p1 TRINITY_DN4919_c0_g2~~TRINITY_DN4919_c0_g2_i1.p1  ORF type:complete len:400 (+),score=68.84 TRINITY_DN4919_c0_g2_i1:74-1273(+)
MMEAWVLSCFFFLVTSDGLTPEQIHIAVTNKQDEMSVTWLTQSNVTSPLVQFGLDPTKFSSSVLAYTTKQYTFLVYTSGYIHYARLSGLQPNLRYYYRVGNSETDDWSDVFHFSTGRQLPISFFATGDVGTTPYCQDCGNVIGGMVDYDKKNPVNFVAHSGDLSYANGYQPVWDQWLNQLQPLASHLPYMVAVGNHVTLSLWEACDYRFDMPSEETGSSEGNLYYSFDYGPVHFIALNSEAVVFWHWLKQYSWLEKDLASVNRQETPWVFVFWHRPWYCSNVDHQGSASWMREDYEDLLYKYKVDINFVGHVHAYERTKPIYKGSVVEDAMVTILNGNGGNNEGLAKIWEEPQPDWSVYRESNWGFGVSTIYNSTHLHWQMIRADNHSVADDWWFVRQH